MTDVILVKYKVKQEKQNIWIDWSEELKRRKEEVLGTLISQDGEYVFIFMEANDMKYAQEVGRTSKFAIDSTHKEKRLASLEFVEVLQELFHFETIS